MDPRTNAFSASALALAALVAWPLAAAQPIALAPSDVEDAADPALFFTAGPCDEQFCERCIAYTIAWCAAQASVVAKWDCSIQQSNGTVTGCTCRGECEFGGVAARMEAIL